MYTNISELLNLAVTKEVPLWRVILKNETALLECSEDEVWDKLRERYAIMEHSAAQALSRSLDAAGSMINGIAAVQYAHVSNENSLSGPFINLLMARALSCSETNAAMGKICAAPTAGSCGILPAVLISTGERYHADEEELLKALLTASGLGAVVMKNATVAGAVGGCQAECGVAAAMAAAAAVQLGNGSDKQALQAFSLALMNCLGLVCDPVAGLVQIPCAQRNASQAVNAVISADMVMAGMMIPIPADEIVEAMCRVGQMLPCQLRETAQGGTAATPSGKAIAQNILENNV